MGAATNGSVDEHPITTNKSASAALLDVTYRVQRLIERAVPGGSSWWSTVGLIAGADTLERRDLSLGAIVSMQLDR